MADTPILLSASDLSLEYPAHSVSEAHTPVRGFTLQMAPGDAVGLVGSSGSGKSSLAKVLSGNFLVDRTNAPRIVGGALHVLGFDLRRGIRGRSLNRFTFAVSYLPQDARSGLTANMTVAEYVAEPLFLRDKKFPQRVAGLRVSELLDALMLPVGTLTKLPHELSSGQRQRVAIARALILQPVLFVADEPTAGVDISVRRQVVDMVTDYQRSRGAAVIVVSHDVDILRRSVDRVVVLHEGSMVAVGTLDEVLADPRHPYIAGLARSVALRREHRASRAEAQQETHEPGDAKSTADR